MPLVSSISRAITENGLDDTLRYIHQDPSYDACENAPDKIRTETCLDCGATTGTVNDVQAAWIQDQVHAHLATRNQPDDDDKPTVRDTYRAFGSACRSFQSKGHLSSIFLGYDTFNQRISRI